MNNLEQELGYWYEGATDLDNVAYSLYILENKIKFKIYKFALITQMGFMNSPLINKEYYVEAKLYLRKQKIENLIKNK